MKIWIDLTAPPHASFFRALMQKMDDVVVTARDFGPIKESLNRYGIDYTLVGRHGGRGRMGKLVAGSQRIVELARIVEKEKPDIGFFKHGIEGSRVCYGLGIPCVNVIDHDSALIQNRLMIPLSDVTITPSFVSPGYLAQFGPRKLRQFFGVSDYTHFIGFRPSKHVLKQLKLSERKPIVITRPEPFLSSHVFRKSKLYMILAELVDSIDAQVVFVPRNTVDAVQFSKLDVIIPGNEVDIQSLYWYANLMLGAGCCMNREAALSGCPTISIYPDELPAVDRFMIEKGLMRFTLDTGQALKWSIDALMKGERESNGKIIGKFENPYKIMFEEAEKLLNARISVPPSLYSAPLLHRLQKAEKRI
ncbi:MAG: DUF354 domain-containing protein [Candidatus Aenigmatarchaeota archaeon]